MQAPVGDWVVVGSRHVGIGERRGEIVEVRGEAGAPPWLVRWSAEGREALYFPGPDATIEHR